MENKSGLFLVNSVENFEEIFVPEISTTVETFSQETQIYQQVYQQINVNEFFTDFHSKDVCFVPYIENQSFDHSITQFPVDYFYPYPYPYPSVVVPVSDPSQFNYYPTYPTYPTFAAVAAAPPLPIKSPQNSTNQLSVFAPPPNYFSSQQSLQYIIIPQKRDGDLGDQFSDSTCPLNHFDSPNSSSSNFINQSPKPFHSQLNSTIENSNNDNNHNHNFNINEYKLEKRKQRNRIAAQKAREKEKIFLNTLKDENERLKREYDERVDEINRLNFILNQLKEGKKKWSS